jgi:hypothetical protein
MITKTSPRRLHSVDGRRGPHAFGRATSPRAHGLRIGPEQSRLFAYEDGSLPSDAPLSRLLRMSLYSLRGYLEMMDLSPNAEFKTFADVMIRQRYAQCRQLASFLEHFGYSAVESDRKNMALRVAWVRALAELDQGNLPRFTQHVASAEQLLEDACLETAMEISCDAVRDTLHEYAVNLYGAQERLEELLITDKDQGASPVEIERCLAR